MKNDSKYREKLALVLDNLIEIHKNKEEYELCQCCLDIKNEIPNAEIEDIKQVLNHYTELLEIIK